MPTIPDPTDQYERYFGFMLNLDRAETRRAHGMLSAILTASAGQIGKKWFEAMADSPDQASEEFDRHKWLSESAGGVNL